MDAYHRSCSEAATRSVSREISSVGFLVRRPYFTASLAIVAVFPAPGGPTSATVRGPFPGLPSSVSTRKEFWISTARAARTAANSIEFSLRDNSTLKPCRITAAASGGTEIVVGERDRKSVG